MPTTLSTALLRLALLLDAFDCARDGGSPLADFAVEIEFLPEAGITLTALRWLAAKGLARRVREINLRPALPAASPKTAKRRLHDTIKYLNRGQRVQRIHFAGVGGGEAVTWQLVSRAMRPAER